MQKGSADVSRGDRASWAATDMSSERASTASYLAESAHHDDAHTHEKKNISQFFHKLSRKLKLTSSPADDLESLLSDLGFDLDFVSVVQQPPSDLMADAVVCMKRLDRVRKVFVASKEEHKDLGTVVNIEVTLDLPPRTELPAQQSIFHPGASSSTTTAYMLTRPFDDCRKLRKVIQFFGSHGHDVSASARASDQDEQLEHERGAGKTCAYCAGLKKYADWCWEQPPLMATAIMSKMAIMRKIVLTNSLTYFIHLARAKFPESVAARDNDSTTQDASASAD
ncbi:hypothetical protein Gpo141_00013736, partial [Globisporangium polare]